MIPFIPVIYYQPETGENSQIYKPGFVEITKKINKFEKENDVLELVYASPTYHNPTHQQQTYILVYEVNKDYFP